MRAEQFAGACIFRSGHSVEAALFHEVLVRGRSDGNLPLEVPNPHVYLEQTSDRPAHLVTGAGFVAGLGLAMFFAHRRVVVIPIGSWRLFSRPFRNLTLAYGLLAGRLGRAL